MGQRKEVLMRNLEIICTRREVSTVAYTGFVL
jgi:hypothetical protein